MRTVRIPVSHRDSRSRQWAGGKGTSVAAVHRRARISKQSESQLPVVAAIGVHCPHNCRASLLRTVPGTDEVDGSAAGVAAASTAWGHAEAGGTD